MANCSKHKGLYNEMEKRLFFNQKPTVMTLENGVNDLRSKYENLSKRKNKVLYSYVLQVKNIEHEIELFRKEILDEFDWYISKIRDRCSSSVNMLADNVDGTWCTRLKGMDEELKKLQEQITDIKQNKAKVDLQGIELDIKLKCKAISEMDDVFEHQFDHGMSLMPNFKSFLIKLSSALTDLTFDQHKTKEYKGVTPCEAIFLKSFVKITVADIQRQFQTTNLRGCTTSSGKLVFSDYGSHQLLVYLRDGHFERVIKLKGKPFCVTSTEHGKVAISFHDMKCVEIYDLKTDSVCQVFWLDQCCAGISYHKGKIIVRVEDFGYKIWDVYSGDVLHEVRIDGKNMPYVSYIDERIYFTNWNTGKVICSDMNGNALWEFKNEILRTPNGIATDSFGNVFVSGFSSNNVVVISKDGLSARSIISDESLEKPIGIYYDSETDELLVTTATGKGILYKVESS